MSAYPTSVITFTTKTNEVDDVDAAHVNSLQDEVVALQQYVGTNPHGSQSDLTTRLSILQATNGAFAQGNSFPGAPVDGQFFYRKDEDLGYVYNGSFWKAISGQLHNSNGFPASTYNGQFFYRSDLGLAYINTGTTWVVVGQQLSANIFSWSGMVDATQAAQSRGIYNGPALRPTSASGADAQFLFYVGGGNATGTFYFIDSKLRKISGLSSLRCYTKTWRGVSGASSVGIVRVNGALIATGNALPGDSPAWSNAFTLDISGLTNDTDYQLEIGVTDSGGDSARYFLGAVAVFGA